MRKITQKQIDKFKKEAIDYINGSFNEGDSSLNSASWDVNYLMTQLNKLTIILLIGEEILQQEGYGENGRKR